MKLFAYALRAYDELGYMEAISKELGFEFGWTEEYPCPENAELARGYDAVSVVTTEILNETLDRFHDLGIRAIASRSIGYDHIDLAHAAKLGMRVGHTTYPPEGVANYAIMLMMMALRQVKYIAATAQTQDFSLAGKIGRDISGCTIGVVGTGAIGACVIRHLQGFGCRILAYNPHPKDELRDLCAFVDLDTLLAESDVVTLHAPALPENIHMIGAPELARMRQGAVLVNTARGALVDTDALIDAIESGHLGAAGLDTIENELTIYYHDKRHEPLPNRDRAILMSYPNVIVLPHMAFYTEENVRDMVWNSTRALIAFVNGEDSPFEVHQ